MRGAQNLLRRIAERCGARPAPATTSRAATDAGAP